MPLFRTILLAADFSERSREAFHAACSLAYEAKTRVFVLHVVGPDTPWDDEVAIGAMGFPITPADTAPVSHEILKERLRTSYVPDRPLDITYLLRNGDAAHGILLAASELGADLIVLGTHGRTGLKRLLVGSVAEVVLRSARCPVLALRSSGTPAKTAAAPTILFPTDLSNQSLTTAAVARALARDQGARLVLLFVLPIEVYIDAAAAVAIDPAIFRGGLEELRRRLEGSDLKFRVETRLVRGDAAREILSEAEELGANLIVMGTHSRTGLPRLVLGSVAEMVLRRSICPVVVVKGHVPAAVTEPEPASV